MAYRISRNIEASIIDYINAELTSGGWTNINVEKGFARVYNLPDNVPAVAVRLGVTSHERTGIGTTNTYREPQVLIDIFATDDGMRLDLKDFLVSKLKKGCTYYEYTKSNGQISEKTANGTIAIIEIEDEPINFNEEKNNLEAHDRYRHLLTLTISLGKVED